MIEEKKLMGLDKPFKIVLNYYQIELPVVRCGRCHGIIGEKLTGKVTLKCKHCGQLQEFITAQTANTVLS